MHKLAPTFLEKIWGSRSLAPWFSGAPAQTGEVWFGPARSILVKFIFTSERLSVQVHPGGDTGKTEMWHILRAEPGASIALGFREPLTRERMREASLSGEIEELLEWMPVQAGETYFTPAGTVHAIGAGIALCEIQQNSDITYRLYDYGRPRELHLDSGLEVAEGGPHGGRTELPVLCQYFETSELFVGAGEQRTLTPRSEALLITLEGRGTTGGRAFRAGEVWSVEDGGVIAASESAKLLYTAPPAR